MGVMELWRGWEVEKGGDTERDTDTVRPFSRRCSTDQDKDPVNTNERSCGGSVDVICFDMLSCPL